jgi:hypothetical protein
MKTQAPPTQRHAEPATPKHILPFIACLALCSIFSLPGLAAEAQAEPTGHQNTERVNPSGTWTWTTPLGKNIPERRHVLTLKLDNGDTLTGALASPGATRSGNATPITAAKLDYNTISFTVARQSGTSTIIQKFSGTLTNDLIKGYVAFEFNGKTNSAPWTAKRQPEGATQEPAGRSRDANFERGKSAPWQFPAVPKRTAQTSPPPAATSTNRTQ